MDIYVRDLHNDIIKLSDNCGWESLVDSVIHKILINDTTLRLFIPEKVRNMATRLRQICGWEI